MLAEKRPMVPTRQREDLGRFPKVDAERGNGTRAAGEPRRTRHPPASTAPTSRGCGDCAVVVPPLQTQEGSPWQAGKSSSRSGTNLARLAAGIAVNRCGRG